MRRRPSTTTTLTTSKLAMRGAAAPWNVFGHDESLFRTGFFKLSVMALKRPWSGVNALQQKITQTTTTTTTSYMFYVCPTVSTHWCLLIAKQDHLSHLFVQQIWIAIPLSWWMAKKVCFFFNLINVFWWCCVVCLKLDVFSEFSYTATEKSFQQVFLTLNSFSNNTYIIYIYAYSQIWIYLYRFRHQVIAFCGVGYFKGLKHSIFKSCHQLPASVLVGIWCNQLFTVRCLFKNVKYFSKNVILGRSKAQKKLNL